MKSGSSVALFDAFSATDESNRAATATNVVTRGKVITIEDVRRRFQSHYGTYPPEFWQRAFALADAPQGCEKCRMFHDEKNKPYVVIRLVLTGDGTPCPERLHLLCKRCYPDPRPRRYSRKSILAKISDLPFPETGAVESDKRGGLAVTI